MPYTKDRIPFVNSSTSQAAAQISPRRFDKKRVYGNIRLAWPDGKTDDENEIDLKLPHQTASARRRGLVQDSLVKDSGKERPTRTGAMAKVWVVEDPNFTLDKPED